MNHQGTDRPKLIAVDEAAKFGARSAPFAMVISLSKDYHLPGTVHSSNVRAARRDQSIFMLDGVVLRAPIVFCDRLILVESTAPLIGFYNAELGALCAAYGSPILHRAWDVTVAATFRPYVNSTPAIVYETVTLNVLGEHTPKSDILFTP